jgi:beta-glucosidase
MLVGNLTDVERIQQLVKYSVPVPRLGVPGYNWHMEAAHGAATGGDVTVFPCSLARAATFNLDLERQVCEWACVVGRRTLVF